MEIQTKRLMQAVGYRGPLDIGYRFDARDGKYKLLDEIRASAQLFAYLRLKTDWMLLARFISTSPARVSRPRGARRAQMDCGDQ